MRDLLFSWLTRAAWESLLDSDMWRPLRRIFGFRYVNTHCVERGLVFKWYMETVIEYIKKSLLV